MFNFKYVVGGAALIFASVALAGGPDVPVSAPAPEPSLLSGIYASVHSGVSLYTTYHPYERTGWDFGGALGYRWDNIRFEVEGSYVQHTLEALYSNPAFLTPHIVGGGLVRFSQLETLRVMANLIYDFDYGYRFVPYAGLGLGWQNIWSNATVSQNDIVGANRTWNLEQAGVAAQALIGVNYKIGDAFMIGVNYAAILVIPPNYRRLYDHAIIGLNTFSRANAVDNQFNASLTLFF